jgi:PRTRC genetic system ThiF family protein
MRPLVIDRPVPYLLEEGDFLIVLVGCGGTGSHLALTLARLAAHCRTGGGPALRLIFIDGDRVLDHNVGRQLFSSAEATSGVNKAATLAGRCNAVFGLDIEAIPRMADATLLRQVLGGSGERHRLLVGAVDGAAGRLACHAVIEMADRDGWHPQRRVAWLDVGNHEVSGQVLVGTTASLPRLRRAIALGGLCRDLPAPALLAPALLTAPAPRPGQACAAAVADNRQSLLINQQLAAVAGPWLADLVVRRRIEHFRTEVDLLSLSMRSTPITAGAIAEVVRQATNARRRQRRKERTDDGTAQPDAKS